MTTTTVLRRLMLGAALAVTAAGCGSSTAAPAKDPNPTATKAQVDGFCTTSKALTVQIGTLAANPAAATAVNQGITTLNATAKSLSTANSWATAGINACLQTTLAAMQAAGVAPKGAASATTVAGTGTTVKGGASPTTAKGGATSSGNADVDAFCKSVNDLIDSAKAAQGDATKIAQIQQQAQALAGKASAIITANPSLAPAVQACIKNIATALGAGTVGGGGGATTPTFQLPTTVAPAATTPGTTTPDTATSSSDQSTATTAGAAPSGDVAAFCKAIDDLIPQIKAAETDPAKSAQLATLLQQLQTLISQGSAMVQANPSQADQISACLQKLSTIGG